MTRKGTTTSLGPLTLAGRVVRLEPLRAAHGDALGEAARDEDIWTWHRVRPTTPEGLDEYLHECARAEAAGEAYTFAVVLIDTGRVVGATGYLDVDEDNRTVEIGGTWYSPDVWGTAVNPDAKHLLLEHAFETWGAVRVCLKTDELNERSRAAIEKLGARFEGILRNHRVRRDGTHRNSVFYSIIDTEWPEVETGLAQRLDRADPTTA